MTFDQNSALNKTRRTTIMSLALVFLTLFLASFGYAAWDNSLSNGLVSYYNLNGSGNDVVTGHYNLSLHVGTYATALIGNGLSNDYLYGNFDIIELSTKAVANWSFCLWVQKTNTGSQAVGGMDDAIGSDFNINEQIFITHAGVGTRWQDAINDWEIATNTVDILPLGWRFICLVHNSTSFVSYLNNSVMENLGPGTSNAVSIKEIVLGGSKDDGSALWQGLIDEVGLWNRTLSNTEISQLWNGGVGITYLSSNDVYPLFNNITYTPTNNSVYAPGGATYIFNTTVVGGNGTIGMEFNGVNYTTSNYSNIFSSSVINLGANTYSYYWWGYSNGTTPSYKTSGLNYYTVAKKPLVFITNVTTPIFVGTASDYTGVVYAQTITTADLYRNGTLIKYGQEKPIGSGIWYVNDTSVLPVGIYTYNFSVTNCDSNYLCSDDIKTLIVNSNVVENGFIFNANSYETKQETFIYNLTYNSAIYLSVASTFNYNGITYPSTITTVGSNTYFTSTIDVPLVTSGTTQYNTFYWNITAYTPTTTTIIGSTFQHQNVSKIFLAQCNSTITTSVVNFTAYDDTNLTRINPFNFQGSLNYYLGSGSVLKNMSVSNSNASEIDLCITPTDKTFKTNGLITFGDNGINYIDGNYYFNNKNFTSDSQNISLLLSSKVTNVAFIILVQTYSLSPIADAYVKIERYYPGTDSYQVINVVKTNAIGQATSYFIPYTVDYRFTITKDGETLLTTDRQKVIPQETPYTLTFTVGTIPNPMTQLTNSTVLGGLSSALYYNYTTRNVTYSYIDTSGLFENARLLVLLQNATGNKYTICNVTSTQSSSSLICDVTGFTGTIEAYGFNTRNGNEQLDKSLITDIVNYSNVFGRMGIFIGVLIILCAGMAFLWHLIAGVIAIDVAVILVNLTHLINFGWTFIFAMIAISIIVILALGDR